MDIEHDNLEELSQQPCKWNLVSFCAQSNSSQVEGTKSFRKKIDQTLKMLAVVPLKSYKINFFKSSLLTLNMRAHFHEGKTQTQTCLKLNTQSTKTAFVENPPKN